jgi:hypothetical protein
MSRAHVRTTKTRSGRSPLFKAGLGATTFAVTVVLLILVIGREPFDHSHLTARGTILDARIVPIGALDGGRGGKILYRIEALVRYTGQGQMQERWLPVEYNYPYDAMVARLAHRPEACEVFWLRRHPENAKCRFYDDFH